MGRSRLRVALAVLALALSPTCTCEEPDPLPPEPEIAKAPEPTPEPTPEPMPEPIAFEPTPAPDPTPAPEPTPAPVTPAPVTPAPEPKPAPAPEPARASEPPSAPEVEFAWHQPRDGVFTPFANITLSGEAEPGTWLKVRNGPKLEVTGTTFEIPLTLKEGKNRIHLIVTEIGRKTIQHRRTVTFVDLDRIERIRERINAQRKTVEELEQIRSDLVTTIADIRSVVPSLPPDVAAEVGSLVDELDNELSNLGQASEGLDGDIDRELAHIDDIQRRVKEIEVE